MAYHTQSRDTARETERIQVEAWRRMAPAQKLRIVSELVRATEELARAGIRERYPDAGEREVELHLRALRLDRATMIRLFDWDPEIRGY